MVTAKRKLYPEYLIKHLIILQEMNGMQTGTL